MAFITMLDSVNADALPSGDYAYAGYVDGDWPSYSVIKARFPDSDILSITVSSGDDADCIDMESGDATVAEAVAWLERKLAAGVSRPCVYADVSTMSSALGELERSAGTLDRIRIWTAHYGALEHICGPGSCGLLAVNADGTQWTDQNNPLNVDISLLLGTFFSSPPRPHSPSTAIPAWETDTMNLLPTLQEGSTDTAGSTFFVHRAQALAKVIGQINSLATAAGLATDGSYGAETVAGIKEVQGHFKLTQDGITGPETWGVLVTGAP